MKVGEKIKEKRKAMHLSQAKLASAAGISQSTLSDIESSTKNPSTETIMLIAQALDCPVWELLGEEPPKDEPMYTRPGMKILFDTASTATDEQLQAAINYIEFLKHQSEGK